jgi:hypothetical protein
VPEGGRRPTLGEVIRIYAVIAVIVAFNLITHDDVFTAVIALVICGGYLAWYFWSHRYQ